MGRARKRKVKYVQPGYRHRARAVPPSPAERIARLSEPQVLERITKAKLHQKELDAELAALIDQAVALDHLEVDVKHNETSHFTELLEPLDLHSAVVTFDALHTVRANLDWLAREKKAHYIAVVKKNQPLLHARLRALPWRQIPAATSARGTGHGRIETRTLKSHLCPG